MISGSNTLGLRIKAGSSDEKVAVLKLLGNIKGINDVFCADSIEPGCLDYTIYVDDDADVRSTVINRLTEQNVTVLQLSREELDLEQIFLRLTDKDYEEAE